MCLQETKMSCQKQIQLIPKWPNLDIDPGKLKQAQTYYNIQ